MKTQYEYNGMKGIPAIAKSLGMAESTLYARLKKGMPFIEAVETPPDLRGVRVSKRKMHGIKKPSMSPFWALALGVQL